MMNRFSSRASGSLAASRVLRGASLLVLATLAVTSQVLGGCVVARVIGDASDDGGGTGGTAGATTTGTTTTGTPSTAADMTTTGPTGGGGAGGGQGGFSSIAMFNAQASTGDTSAWLSDGEALEPATLLIVIATDHDQSCAAPKFDFDVEKEGTTKSFHQVIFGLSSSVQRVGKYDLASTDVIAFEKLWRGDGTGVGWGGWGPIRGGTIEVLSIDDASIQVRVELPPDPPETGRALYDGDFVVPRCP